MTGDSRSQPNIRERLRVWPSAYGEDAMSSTYVGEVMKQAAERIEALELALQEILNPIRFMQERASATNDRIDGMIANHLARDPEHLRRIARAALQSEKTP